MNKNARIALSAAVLFISLMAAAQAAPGARGEGPLGPGAKNVRTKALTAGPVDAAGRTLRFDSTLAQLTITAWEKNEVSAEATVEVGDADPGSTREFLDGTALELEAEADGLALRLRTPLDRERMKTIGYKKVGGRSIRSDRWNVSYAARVVVHVPASQSLDVSNSLGDIEVHGLTGRLKIRNESGKVRVEGCGGELEVENGFADVHVADFRGAIDVRNESGDVLAEDINGAVNVEISFNSVVLRRTSGPIKVNGEDASVDIAEIKALPPGSVIDVKTSFQPIRLTLPSGTEFRGTAKAEFGKVVTEIPVTLLDPGSPDGQAVSFGAGKGGVMLKLETTGDITIQKR